MQSRVRIKSLRLQNFGYFEDQKFVFEDGLNVIAGPNESGKSTVVEAILTALFEDGSTRKKGVSALGNWRNKQPARITLEFRVDKSHLTLVRDYNTGQDTLTDQQGVTYEGKAIGEKLQLYFTTVDRLLYEAVYCFRSENPEMLVDQQARLKSALEAPALSGYNRSKADKFLQEEIKKLENPRAHGPRELDILSERIEKALHEKSELEERLDTVRKDKVELDKSREQLTQFEEDVERLERELSGATAYEQVSVRMDNIEERLQTYLAAYSRVVQATEDLERLSAEEKRILIPNDSLMDEFRTQSDQFKQRVDVTKQKMDTLILQRRKASKGFLAGSVILALVTVVYVLTGQGMIGFGDWSFLIPYLVPFAGLVWLFRGGVYLLYFNRKKAATKGFRQAVAKLDDLYQEINNLYDMKAADPIRGLEQQINRKQALQFTIANLKETIDALSEGKGIEHLQAIKSQLEGEVARVNEELAALASFAPLAGKIPDIKEELTAKRVRIDAMRERIAHLDERCSVLEPLETAMESLNGSIEALKRKHTELSERLEVFKIIRMTLNRAADRMIEDLFNAYGKAASVILMRLSGNRYKEIRFDKETGKFEILIPEIKEWLEVDSRLSSSTLDVIYLSFRLAAADQISEYFMPCIIFDQPDVRMDNLRKESFHRQLAQISAERQALYVGVDPPEQIQKAHIIKLARHDMEPTPVTVP
jgi:DNA repair exonuclease SbcCD ATPase subunit